MKTIVETILQLVIYAFVCLFVLYLVRSFFPLDPYLMNLLVGVLITVGALWLIRGLWIAKSEL